MRDADWMPDANDEEDDTDQEDSAQEDSEQDSGNEDVQEPTSGAQALDDAAPHEVEAHRNMIGDALQQLSDRGIDVASLAEKAGISSSDVDELSHGDLANLTQYLSQNHPEALQAVASRFPAAQGLLGSLSGGSGGGGFLGGLLGRVLGG